MMHGLLVTDDTTPGRIPEAQVSGFLLLHKPIHAASWLRLCGL